MSDLDFLDDLPADGGRKGRKPAFRSALDDLRLADRDAATVERRDTTDLSEGRKKHNISPYREWVERIDAIADELEVSKMDAWNAILYLGFQAYDAGVRPPTRERPRARKRLAIKGRAAEDT